MGIPTSGLAPLLGMTYVFLMVRQYDKLQFEYLYLMVSSFSSKDKPEIDTGTEIVYNDEKM